MAPVTVRLPLIVDGLEHSDKITPVTDRVAATICPLWRKPPTDGMFPSYCRRRFPVCDFLALLPRITLIAFLSSLRDFFHHLPTHPALKRWAKLFCPSGTGSRSLLTYPGLPYGAFICRRPAAGASRTLPWRARARLSLPSNPQASRYASYA